MGHIDLEIKKLIELREALDDIEKLKSPAFYKELSGKEAEENVKLIRVITLIEGSVLQILETLRAQTPGHSLHQLENKKILARILRAIDIDLGLVVKASKPAFFQSFLNSAEDTNFNELANKIKNIQKQLKGEIEQIKQDSSTLFETALQDTKSAIHDALRCENDRYLAEAMGIQSKVEAFEVQEKKQENSLVDIAASVHEIVQDQLKKQSESQLKCLVKPSELTRHIKNLTNICQKHLNDLVENKLFCDLSDAEKSEKIEAALPRMLANNKFQIESSFVKTSVESEFLAPFEDKDKTGKALFSSTQSTLQHTIKKILINIKTFFLFRFATRKNSQEIKSMIQETSKKYYAESNNKTSKALLNYRKIQIIFDAHHSISAYLKDKKVLAGLNSVPIKEKNKEFLTGLWEHMLASAYPDQEMSHRSRLAHYKQYLLIKDHIPDTLREHLEFFAINEVEKNHKGSEIRILVESHDKALTKEEQEIIEILASALENNPKPLNQTQESKLSAFMNSAAGNLRVNRIAKNAVNPKKGILWEWLDLLNTYLSDTNELGPIGNRLNEFLTNLLEKLKPVEDLSFSEKEALEFLAYFSWKTRHLDDAEKAYEKLKQNVELVQNGKLPVEKVTLKEYSLLRDVINLKKRTKKISETSVYSIICKNEMFNKKIFELSEKAEALNATIKELASAETLNAYQSGDIVTTDSTRKAQLKDSKVDFENKLLGNFVSKYNHAGIVINDGRKIFFSEILINHHLNRTMSINQVLINDIWRLDPSQLLEGMNIEYMIEMYRANGITDWRKEIQKEYSKIASRIHNKDFSKLRNNTAKRVWAGVADFIPGAHKGKEITNWKEKVNKKLFPEEEGKDIMCSSFATETTILALVELNEFLAKNLVQYFKANKNDKLSTFFENSKKVFTIPYSQNLKLSTAHPGMMVDLLLKKKCLKKVEPPPTLKKLFAF